MHKPRLLALCASLFSLGCIGLFPQRSREEWRRIHDDQNAAESSLLAYEPDTTYRRRMYDLIRRSSLVPVDSLARIYVAMSLAPVKVRKAAH